MISPRSLSSANADRTAELRRRCLQRSRRGLPSDPVVACQSLRTSQGQPWQVRAGRLTRDRVAALRFEVDELGLLIGRVREPREQYTPAQIAEAEAYLREYPWPGGQTGHCELDLSRLYAGGLDGIRTDLRGRLAAADGEAAQAYQSFLDAVDGLATMIAQAAEDVARSAASADGPRAAELAEMAAVCRHLVHAPPRTFREALQALWFVLVAVQAGDNAWLIGPGHLDRSLSGFYTADRAAGRSDYGRALHLVECLYVLINEFIPAGLAIPVMVGGRDADGADVTNELSFIGLEALRRVRLVYPTVGVCWHEGTPGELTDLAVELMADGCPNPAFFGDATIQRGLRDLGVPASEACHYINSTCVEISPVGASNVWVASPYFPIPRFILDEMAAEVASGESAGSFDEFTGRCLRRLDDAVAAAAAEQNTLREARRRYGRKPLQSVFTRDCIERGRDLDDGGARYNWVECSFVGLANAADSLAVIEEEVFRQRRVSLPELKRILDADFAGHEAERQRFLNRSPKYGTGEAGVDGLVQRIVDACRAACAPHRMRPDDSPYVPGTFCWIMHERLGRETGATPDGRHAGFPLADGCGPAQGRERRGPTAAILSTTSWNHAPMIGGAAYNMKFNRALFRGTGGADAGARLRDLILTFLRRGGFETQVNVVAHDLLSRARANPEPYCDLVVRIGGYTDYFTRLTPEMQDEILMRTEFQGL